MNTASTVFSNPNYAIYLPAVNANYAKQCVGTMDASRPFPKGLSLKDLIFWQPNGLWHYPYLLHSVGLHSVGTLPDNAVTQRDRSSSTLVGDSGGFQIGKGTMKGMANLKEGSIAAEDAAFAWKREFAAREWILSWLDTHADYAATIDMPLWATSEDGRSSPFHKCSPDQLIAMTVDNLRFVDQAASGRAKWLNVIQGDADAVHIGNWWNAVKWFRRGGWAMAGSAGVRGGLVNLLRTLLIMRDDDAFAPGQDWLHVLGVSTPKWAILLSAVQNVLKERNPALRVSFDSSSAFLTGGRYEEVALSPTFTADERSWSIAAAPAPQSRLHVDPSSPKPFPYAESPLGAILQLHHLSVKGDIWDARQFDSVSNLLLTHHNLWVYLDAMGRANDLAAAKDAAQVPKLYLDCIALIESLFKGGSWAAELKSNAALLDAVAPSKYRLSEELEIIT